MMAEKDHSERLSGLNFIFHYKKLGIAIDYGQFGVGFLDLLLCSDC